jgi:hypothetical protein
MDDQGRSHRFSWVYVLPAVHLIACFIADVPALLIPRMQSLGIVQSYLIVADFPISIGVFALAWQHPLLAYAWIWVVGTLWWYLLSRVVRYIFENHFAKSRSLSIVVEPKPQAEKN